MSFCRSVEISHHVVYVLYVMNNVERVLDWLTIDVHYVRLVVFTNLFTLAFVTNKKMGKISCMRWFCISSYLFRPPCTLPVKSKWRYVIWVQIAIFWFHQIVRVQGKLAWGITSRLAEVAILLSACKDRKVAFFQSLFYFMSLCVSFSRMFHISKSLIQE